MKMDLLEKWERPATAEDVINEVSKLRSVVADAVDDGVRSALRAIRHGRHAAEDVIDDAKHVVKRNPLQAMGVFFAAGVVTGCLVTMLGSRRR